MDCDFFVSYYSFIHCKVQEKNQIWKNDLFNFFAIQHYHASWNKFQLVDRDVQNDLSAYISAMKGPKKLKHF